MKRKGYNDGIVRYPISIVDHKETAKVPLQDDVDSLKEFKQRQETIIQDNEIKGIAEIENFLNGTSDATTMKGLVSSLIDSIQMDEESGDITIEYEGSEETTNE